MRHIAAAAAMLAASPAMATPLPAAARAMVEAAARSGDQTKIDAVAGIARETNPDSIAEIDSILSTIAADLAAQRAADLRQAGVFDNWSGSGQVGGSVATGNSDAIAVAVGINLKREGLAWRHVVTASADVQRDRGTTTQELFGLSGQSDWKFSSRGFAFVRLGWERNRQAGINARFTETAGLGYALIQRPGLAWSVEGGPGFSQTRFSAPREPGGTTRENRFAARGATNLVWDLGPTTQFKQNASILYQSQNTAISATSALTARLIGALATRLSFTLAHETDPPPGLINTDTISRISLVYDF